MHLKEGCLCLREIFIIVNKWLALVLLPVLLIGYFLYCTLLLPVYSLIPLFILMLLLYFCLIIDHVNKSIIFVFGAFIYDFKNSISIFVPIQQCLGSITFQFSYYKILYFYSAIPHIDCYDYFSLSVISCWHLKIIRTHTIDEKCLEN